MHKSFEVIVFRHGETDWNLEGRIQGATDIPLNAAGHQQAKALGLVLCGTSIRHILSSDLSRSIHTAHAVSQALGVGVTTDPGLREACYGEGEGILVDEMRQRLGSDFYRRWRSYGPDDWDIGFPGGETKRVVLARSRAAVERSLTSHSVPCLGVSTHGGVLRFLAHACLPSDAPAIAITNCVAYRFVLNTRQSVGFEWTFVGPLAGTLDLSMGMRAAERV